MLKTIANTSENEIIGKKQQPDILGKSDKVTFDSYQTKNNDETFVTGSKEIPLDCDKNQNMSSDEESSKLTMSVEKVEMMDLIVRLHKK